MPAQRNNPEKAKPKEKAQERMKAAEEAAAAAAAAPPPEEPPAEELALGSKAPALVRSSGAASPGAVP